MDQMDDEMKELAQNLEAAAASLKRDYLPALSQLNEDAIVTRYPVEEQVRIYLAVAYTLATALYSLDKLSNEPHARRDTVPPSENLLFTTGGSPCDRRLYHQVEHILRIINELKDLKNKETKGEEVSPAHKKRRREGEDTGKAPSGDDAMFALVERKDLGYGTRVKRILEARK